MIKSVKPLLLTIGEPAGIGSDCVLQAMYERPDAFKGVVVAAPVEWLKARREELGVDVALEAFSSLSAAVACSAAGGVICCWNPLSEDIAIGPVCAGKTSPVTAEAVIGCIRAAAECCLDGDAEGMVTGPIEKAVLKNSGFAFPGHTEFLASLARARMGEEFLTGTDFVMMLASERLRVALLTTHVALHDVAALLSQPLVLDTIRIVHADLQKRFGIAKPRLALCALNPHAGEQGHFGREELDILAPAAAEARALGIDIGDPMPSDTAFSPPIREQFDTMICCYHDQGLIPIKALSFGESINITLGLPFIRTSVDHGTALTLAGTGKASCSSMLEALLLGRKMAG